MKDWRQTELPRIRGQVRGLTHKETPSTPPSTSRSATLQVLPPSGDNARCLRAILQEEVDNFLKSPQTLAGQTFMSNSSENDLSGAWTVASFTVQMVDNRIDHEYQVLLEIFKGAPLPMGEEEVRELLKHSRYIVWLIPTCRFTYDPLDVLLRSAHVMLCFVSTLEFANISRFDDRVEWRRIYISCGAANFRAMHTFELISPHSSDC